MYPLGRRHAADERDQAYRMSARLADQATAALPTYKYWSGWRTHLDQTGDTCVANAWTHFLTDSPRSHLLTDVDTDRPAWTGTWTPTYKSPTSGERGFRGYLYDTAQGIDEFGDTPPAGGTSVRAGAKVLQSIGAIASYHWAFTIQDVVVAVLTTSPVIVGTNWYDDMFNPTGSQYIVTPSGGIAGGHAYKIDGYNQTTRLFRIKNSWGTGWGYNGYAHIRHDDLAALIDDYGEACLALEP